jgi:hypothetical protein
LEQGGRKHIHPNKSTQIFVRGDVQPFIKIGTILKSDGHHVRLATHAFFREFVLSNGLEFYPLAGDPQKLSEFMVKNSGFIVPMSSELLMEVGVSGYILHTMHLTSHSMHLNVLLISSQVPAQLTMLMEIMESCWAACIHEFEETTMNTDNLSNR